MPSQNCLLTPPVTHSFFNSTAWPLFSSKGGWLCVAFSTFRAITLFGLKRKNALILINVSTLMDTKWMGHCVRYALDHFVWAKISTCSMSLTRQMQCNIMCLYFAARGSVQYMHHTTAHTLAKRCLRWLDIPLIRLVFLKGPDLTYFGVRGRTQRISKVGFVFSRCTLTFTLSNSLWNNFIWCFLGEGIKRILANVENSSGIGLYFRRANL